MFLFDLFFESLIIDLHKPDFSSFFSSKCEMHLINKYENKRKWKYIPNADSYFVDVFFDI
jgi:hypothetical protein